MINCLAIGPRKECEDLSMYVIKISEIVEDSSDNTSFAWIIGVTFIKLQPINDSGFLEGNASREMIQEEHEDIISSLALPRKWPPGNVTV